MGKEGTTNPPFKAVRDNWSMIKTISFILFVCVIVYLQSIFFTKAEAKELKKEVDVVATEVQGIKTEIHGFKIEQRHMIKQVDRIVEIMEIEHRRPPAP